MPLKRLITLLSDFGLRDPYVGVMKGVISQIDPELQVIDLTHQVPPQNIAAARFSLMNAYPYFPTGTVHVAVVDPGVGSGRRAIAVELTDGFLVGPDNGLLSGVLSQATAIRAVELKNSQYWRVPQPSFTFHGRDIFAPVAAHLATGLLLDALGPSIDLESLSQLPIPTCQQTNTGITGYIQYVDHFGNLISNIPGAWVDQKSWSVVIQSITLPRGQTYGNVQPGTLVALVGSHGWIEVAVNSGNAQQQLQLGWGDSIQVVFDWERMGNP